MTKSVGKDTPEDITWLYKNVEGSPEERLSVFNAVRGVDRALKYYSVPSNAVEDVFMDLVELERVEYGQAYKARVILEVSSNAKKKKFKQLYVELTDFIEFVEFSTYSGRFLVLLFRLLHRSYGKTHKPSARRVRLRPQTE